MNMRPDPTRLHAPEARPAMTRTVIAPTESAPLHDARALTKGGVQARIALDGQVYALRITRAGKLILTK
jgi:hemin uptake protein HemP